MDRTQRMIIFPAQLTLEEENRTLGLKFSVDYFNVPEDSYAGLVRVLRITNIGRKPAKFEMLDGLPMIVPFGVAVPNYKRYVLLYAPGALSHPGVRAVHDWLVEEAQIFRGMHPLGEGNCE